MNYNSFVDLVYVCDFGEISDMFIFVVKNIFCN